MLNFVKKLFKTKSLPELIIENKNKSNLEKIFKLIETGEGGSLNKTDENRETLLNLACKNGELKLIEFLIKKGAKKTDRDYYIAVKNGNKKLIDILCTTENKDLHKNNYQII